jgi:hypothetical protein
MLNQKLFKDKEIEPVFYEVDLLEVVTKKVSIISQTPELLASLKGEVKIEQTEIHSDNYHLVSVDLNNVDTLTNALFKSNINTSLPTLFLSECVLIYLDPHSSDKIIEWIGSTFKCVSMLTYEQINPFDNFGNVMVQNLKKRGCPLLGIFKYPDLPSHEIRFKSKGFSTCKAVDMLHIYNKYLSQEEVNRTKKIEFLDEYEEWIIILQHYTLVWSLNVVSSIVQNNIWVPNIIQFI